MRFGSLFAGIGGFDLGLERAGMRCAWQVERDAYATKILERHWPNVPRWDDVRTFPPPEGEWGVDVICGGFPCQDISVAGKGAGLAGARSGLWFEFARIIGELRPRYVIVENVAALLTRGMDAVLGTLSTLGYDAEWHVIPASAVGAPHRRERVWIVAYDNDEGESDVPFHDESRRGVSEPAGGYVPDADGERDAVRRDGASRAETVGGGRGDARGSERDSGPGREGRAGQGPGDVADSECRQRAKLSCAALLWGREGKTEQAWMGGCGGGAGQGGNWWATEPDVGRVAHGVSARVDRLRCLGNAVVPQVVELIGRAIMAREQEGGR